MIWKILLKLAWQYCLGELYSSNYTTRLDELELLYTTVAVLYYSNEWPEPTAGYCTTNCPKQQ